MPRKQVGLFCLCLSAVIAGACLGLVYRATSPELIELSTPVISLGEVLEGAKVEAQVAFHNNSWRSAYLTDVSPSCACMQIYPEGRPSSPYPIEIRRGSRVKLIGRVDTTGMIGERVINYSLTSRIGGGNIAAIGSVNLVVRPGWRLNEDMIVLPNCVPGENINRTISVYDAFPDPGVRCERIKVSRGATLKVMQRVPGRTRPSLFSESRDEPESGKNEIELEGFVLTRRFDLDVTYCPAREYGAFRDWIEIFPMASELPSIMIPVEGFTTRRIPYCDPEKVVFRTKEGSSVASEQIRVVVGKAVGAKIRLGRAPSGVTLKETVKETDAMVFEVQHFLKDRRAGAKEGILDLIVDLEGESHVLSLPYRFIEIPSGM